MEKKILKLLYRSLDSALKKKNQGRLDRALEESEKLQQQRSEIISLRKAVADSAIRSFRPLFAERLMQRIQSRENSPDIFLEVFKVVFKHFSVVALLILVFLISYNIVHYDLLPRDQIFYASDVTFGKILQLPIF